MTPEQFEQAKPIWKTIVTVKEQLKRADDICERIITNEKHSDIDPKGGFSCRVSEHRDHSGAKTLDLTGCYVGDAIFFATRDILITKLRQLEQELKAI